MVRDEIRPFGVHPVHIHMDGDNDLEHDQLNFQLGLQNYVPFEKKDMKENSSWSTLGVCEVNKTEENDCMRLYNPICSLLYSIVFSLTMCDNQSFYEE